MATIKDIDLIFQWRNSPWILSHGLSQGKVTYKDHKKWFTESLLNKNRLLNIITSEDEVAAKIPIGLLRLDLDEDHKVVVSIYIIQEFTHQGIGTQVIKLSDELALKHWPNTLTMVAKIRQDNYSSISAFKKAGYNIQDIKETAITMTKKINIYIK